jgi:DNA-binding response OmpR family regulator
LRFDVALCIVVSRGSRLRRETPPVSSKDEKSSVVMLRGPTILVIDDEAASRMALRKVLVAAGYQFVGASTGTEALERMSTEKCEMIILDPALAEDGFELIRLIRRQSLMPIITLSTSDDEHSKVRGLRSRCG